MRTNKARRFGPQTRRSQKRRSQKQHHINGSIKHKNGWIIASVRGTPFERGFAHGYLLHKELKRVRPVLKYLVTTYYKTPLTKYLETCKASMYHHLEKPEWAFINDELRGICAGYKKRTGHDDINYEILVGWNSYLSMAEKYEHKNEMADRCSAFITTHNGNIVMAHNTHTNFASGFISNIALYVYPENEDSAFVMQTAPGLICSSTDWFITKCGIVGCETTIADINYIPDFDAGVPYFLRIRKAMEQGRTLDDYVEIMMTQNAGDYACSWLLGNINNGEIMRFEQGLSHYDIQKTSDGVFYGMNSAFSQEIRSLETTDIGFNDPQSRTGARNLRLEHLLADWDLDIADAKRIISDHYDVSVSKYEKSKRTICKHMECEKEFAPSGATDGKVLDSKMAKTMSFEAIMGSSCGRVFRKNDYPDATKKHGNWKSVVENMPKFPWTSIHKIENKTTLRI